MIKLSDFGNSRYNKNTLANTTAKGTICYMSPELLLIHICLEYSSELIPELCDIFSLGFKFLRLIK